MINFPFRFQVMLDYQSYNEFHFRNYAGIVFFVHKIELQILSKILTILHSLVTSAFMLIIK